jgi:vacuolar protein sorting-associated protein 35
MHNTLSTLYSRVTGAADLSLRLFIACGQVADQNNFEEVAYEYFAQAFTIYEEAISDSRAQFQAVCVVASGLHTTRNFGKENYDTLITKCALHGSKLLKKPDQCRAVYLASHLWWATELRALGEEDPKNVSHMHGTFIKIMTNICSSTATANVCSSAYNVHSVSLMHAWMQQYQWSSSSRS